MASTNCSRDLSYKGCYDSNDAFFVTFALISSSYLSIQSILSLVVKMLGRCLEQKLLDKLDRLRGDIPRAKYLSRLVERLVE
jgi:hypothetical protein